MDEHDSNGHNERRSQSPCERLAWPHLRRREADFPDLAGCVAALPDEDCPLPREDLLALWQEWHAQGALAVSIVEHIGMADGQARLVALLVRIWVNDPMFDAALGRGAESLARQLYLSVNDAQPSPVLSQIEIYQAHHQCDLNLLLVHCWEQAELSDSAARDVYLHKHAAFEESHFGFGVKRMLCEAPMAKVQTLQAAGLREWQRDGAIPDRVLMHMDQARAQAQMGSTFSFLFLRPPARLRLRPATQRMLALAMRQLTDEDIAARLGCTRDYVRSLWDAVYDILDRAGLGEQQLPGAARKNGRNSERRRRCLEFFRQHPQELRPGLPLPSAPVILAPSGGDAIEADGRELTSVRHLIPATASASTCRHYPPPSGMRLAASTQWSQPRRRPQSDLCQAPTTATAAKIPDAAGKRG